MNSLTAARKRAEAAVRTIESLGLMYRTSFRSSGEKTPATERVVLAQKPLPGYPVGADATVEIVVSK